MLVNRIWQGACCVLMIRLEPGELVASTSKWNGLLVALNGSLVEMSFSKPKEEKKDADPKADVAQSQPYHLEGGVVRAYGPGVVDDVSGHNPGHLAAHQEPPRDLKLLWSEAGVVALLILDGDEFATVEYADRPLRIPVREMERIPQALRDRLNVEWFDPFKNKVSADDSEAEQ